MAGKKVGKNDVSTENRWNMFYGPREGALVESYVDEFMSFFAQQVIVFYAVDEIVSNNIYGEAEKIIYRDGIELYAQVQTNEPVDTITEFGYDRAATMTVWISAKQASERLNIAPKIGDLIQFDNLFYEIYNTNAMKYMFGTPETKHAIQLDAFMVRDWKIPTNLPIVGGKSVVPPR